jgi:ammonia channel protein AmtB
MYRSVISCLDLTRGTHKIIDKQFSTLALFPILSFYFGYEFMLKDKKKKTVLDFNHIQFQKMHLVTYQLSKLPT